MNSRPERTMVERAFIENPRRKAHEIAEDVGLIAAIGYDKAVSYVRRVKKSMKIKGQITAGAFATDDERLADIIKLYAMRQGKMSRRAAYMILLLNCYYRLRSEDDDVHMMAMDETYDMNKNLDEPLAMSEAIQICEKALAQYMNSIDEEKNEAARKKGYPGAGLNYTDERLIEQLEITEEELEKMESIKRR